MLVGLTVMGLAGWGALEAYRYGKPFVDDWLRVRDVLVVGVSQVTRQEVLDRLALRPEETLLSVSVGELVEQVAAHPWIKEATVRRRFPQTLVVTIVERQPAAVLKTPSTPLLLDEDGHVLTVLAETDEPDLPLLTGIDPKGLMSAEVRPREAVRIGVRLAGLLESQFQGRPEVDMGNPDNAVVYIQGLRFQFGPSSFEEKWERYRKVEPTLRVSADGERGDLRNDIDLRYPGKVIVRERG
jgi:cell division protein FtsQ